MVLLTVVTQIRGHKAGSYPPLPTTVRVLEGIFYREKTSALSSLVVSHRIIVTYQVYKEYTVITAVAFIADLVGSDPVAFKTRNNL